MQVNKWGPALWIPLHAMTFNYPENPRKSDKERYKTYFESLGTMLPCKYCRQSFQAYSRYLPIDPFLDSREGVTYWLYTIHNLVNEKLFKPSCSFRDVVIKYEQMRAKCGKMSVDSEKNKEIKTCQLKYKNVDIDAVDKFVKRAIQKYRTLAEELCENLKEAPDNPNKDCYKYYEEQKKATKRYVLRKVP